MQNVFARPVWPWVSVIALELAQAITLVPWLVVAGLSVMAFDAPGSTKMWQPWVFVGAVWSYPLWLLAAAMCRHYFGPVYRRGFAGRGMGRFGPVRRAILSLKSLDSIGKVHEECRALT